MGGSAPVSTEGTPLMGPGGLPAGKAKPKSAGEKVKEKVTAMFGALSSLSESKVTRSVEIASARQRRLTLAPPGFPEGLRLP